MSDTVNPNDCDLSTDRGTCTTDGFHQHRWSKRIDGTRYGLIVEVRPSGVVILSEGAVEQMLIAAGFERVTDDA